jgi:succinate dehydrogenase/fumarate reductase flavoprotein subunit
MSGSWDLEYDVVIAGYGFAGGWAALEAHDNGASVAIFEKTRHFGGNSILSGGGTAYSTDYQATLDYLTATCANATSPEVLDVYAREMAELREVLEKFAAEAGGSVADSRGGATYRFPGRDSVKVLRFIPPEDYDGFSWVTGGNSGVVHFWLLHRNVQSRGIPQYYESAVQRLLTDESGTVTGVLVSQGGRTLRVKASRGVILATGGFEHNQELITQYLPLREAYGMSPLGNTGDGVLMAQKAGAALWHMWHVHGSSGFRIPGVPVAIRTPFGGYRNDPGRPGTGRVMPWIAVDKLGQRFMNEWPHAAADTPIRDLEKYDFELLGYPRVPSYLIFDDTRRRLGPIGQPKFNDEDLTFRWSQDNSEEVEKGYIISAESIQELAAAIGINRVALAGTVQQWNDSVAARIDPQFGRTPDSMAPITDGPFYAIPAWPIISNTQGGPVHDAEQRVTDPYGEPIGRLYEAGELGAIWGHVYLLAGNIVECIIGGRIAGRNAARETPWSAEASEPPAVTVA